MATLNSWTSRLSAYITTRWALTGAKYGDEAFSTASCITLTTTCRTVLSHRLLPSGRLWDKAQKSAGKIQTTANSHVVAVALAKYQRPPLHPPLLVKVAKVRKRGQPLSEPNRRVMQLLQRHYVAHRLWHMASPKHQPPKLNKQH